MNTTAELTLCNTVHRTKNQVLKCRYTHLSPDELIVNDTSDAIMKAASINNMLLKDKGTVCRETHSKTKIRKCSFYHPTNRIITTLRGRDVYLGYDVARMQKKLCNGHHSSYAKVKTCNRIHLHPVMALLFSSSKEHIQISDKNWKWFTKPSNELNK